MKKLFIILGILAGVGVLVWVWYKYIYVPLPDQPIVTAAPHVAVKLPGVPEPLQQFASK